MPGTPDLQRPWRLAVLNPGGRDPEQTFPDGPGHPNDPFAPHPPINYHAHAACTGGSFHGGTASALVTQRPILLLLRRDLKDAWRALEQIKAAGRTVVVTFKEAGAMQVAARLTAPADLAMLARIVEAADGCLAPTPWLQTFFSALRPPDADKTVAFIPTPYPVDDPRWNFARSADEKRGIFVGTREWGTPSRQHLAALLAAKEIGRRTGERVSVINPDGRSGAKMLVELGFTTDRWGKLQQIPGPLPYREYLWEMSEHKIVFQLDRSGVPGQVAGDALLCRIPCIGGDGAVEQVAFPGLCGHRRSPVELMDVAEQLIRDPGQLKAATGDSQTRAAESLSFGAVARQLETFFRRLAG